MPPEKPFSALATSPPSQPRRVEKSRLRAKSALTKMVSLDEEKAAFPAFSFYRASECGAIVGAPVATKTLRVKVVESIRDGVRGWCAYRLAET